VSALLARLDAALAPVREARRIRDEIAAERRYILRWSPVDPGDDADPYRWAADAAETRYRTTLERAIVQIDALLLEHA
jgi:hypothetical protein